jgi:arylsulfatase
MGDWKLVADHAKPFELYDMRTDRSETRNLAAQYPGKVREMERAWTRHMEEFRAVSVSGQPVGQAVVPEREPENPPD